MLVKLYQQAIEYYSAVGDPLFNDVLQRQQMLLTRPEIVSMLYPEPTPLTENEKSSEEVESLDQLDSAKLNEPESMAEAQQDVD